MQSSSFYQFSLSERVFQVVNALEAAIPVAFNHGHIAAFSVGSSRLSYKSAGIFSGVQRRALVLLVKLPFEALLWTSLTYLYTDDYNRNGACASSH